MSYRKKQSGRFHGRRMFPACLILTNASLKCKKFQNISLFIFRRQNVSFLQILHRIDKPFSVFFVLVPADSCHILAFPPHLPGFRIHIWIRVLSEKTIYGGIFSSLAISRPKRTEFLETVAHPASDSSPTADFGSLTLVSLSSSVSCSFGIFIVRICIPPPEAISKKRMSVSQWYIRHRSDDRYSSQYQIIKDLPQPVRRRSLHRLHTPDFPSISILPDLGRGCATQSIQYHIHTVSLPACFPRTVP